MTSNMYSPFSSGLVSTNSWQKYLAHQLVSDFVCLLFGAGQVTYSGFIGACLLKTAAENGVDERTAETIIQINYNQIW